MAKSRMQKGAFAHLATEGAEFTLRVTPGARAPNVMFTAGMIHIATTAPAEDGKANRAARRTLAHALGVAPTRLTLVSGATSRTKRFRLD